MATKAERYRYRQERSKAKRARTRKKPRRQSVDTSRPGVSATNQKASRPAESARAGRKASFALEDSPGARPSRKSSRRSSNRAKPDSNLRRRETRRTSSPGARARRARARGK